MLSLLAELLTNIQSEETKMGGQKEAKGIRIEIHGTRTLEEAQALIQEMNSAREKIKLEDEFSFTRSDQRGRRLCIYLDSSHPRFKEIVKIARQIAEQRYGLLVVTLWPGTK